ncbi:MAG: MaoC family dehydratase [Roseobacter sp.]
MSIQDQNELSAGIYFYEDLYEGAFFNTKRMVVTETHIVNFAGISGDFFDVHMDDDFARELGFPARIAHGLLGLCLIDGLKNRADAQLQAVASLGWKEWNFKASIVAGDSICARIIVASMRPTSKKNRGIVELMFEVTNQNSEIVQSGVNTLLMRNRSSE